jgi:hypothetical protein
MTVSYLEKMNHCRAAIPNFSIYVEMTFAQLYVCFLV